MKIDCSKTINFFKEKRRMCNSCNDVVGCENCPLHIYLNEMSIDSYCEYFVSVHPEKAVEIVQQWSDEHPQKTYKTYKEDFFEKFPDAKKIGIGKGYPVIDCPCILYPQLKATCNDYLYCFDCWDKKMEE